MSTNPLTANLHQVEESGACPSPRMLRFVWNDPQFEAPPEGGGSWNGPRENWPVGCAFNHDSDAVST